MPTLNQVKDLLSEITGIDVEKINDGDNFKTDLAMDSIALADLISSLEEDFDIVIEQEEALKITNIKQLMDHIKK